MDRKELSLAYGPLDDLDREALRDLLLARPEWLREDHALLLELGLRLDAANIVDFGPVALSRVSAAHRRESSERRRLESMAQANFAAQTQTHAAVIDVLGATDLPDLAAHVDALARMRFGLAMGTLALEGGDTPESWLPLVEGQVDLILGPNVDARLGHVPISLGLFGGLGPAIESVALVRLRPWRPGPEAIMAFGATDPEVFAEDMGAELVVFLARVVERVAERWPRP